MPALYLFFKNGDILLLGCADSEGTAGYNAVMEDGAGFVDFNSGGQSVRLGVRASEIAAVCYNPQDTETGFASSAMQNLNDTVQRIEVSRLQSKGNAPSAQPTGPPSKS